MSSSQTTTGTADRFERYAPERQRIAYGLIAIGVALAAIPITNGVLYGWQSLAVFLWGALLSLLVLVVGIIYLMMEPAASLRDEADRLRIIVLIVLGGTGLLTALLGFSLPFSAPPLSLTNYRDIFAGGVNKWRQPGNARALTGCGAALLGGLILMFVGLIQARAFERTRTNLRRLLYGYNAVLTSLLLILIVFLLNLLPYAGVWPFSSANESLDWTRRGLYTLHPATKYVLADLKQPVKIYALGSSNDPIMSDVLNLLERCRDINPQQFTWEQLSRDRNATDLRELMKKYQVPDAEGVLVVYGTEPKVLTDFIRHNDLYEIPPTSSRRGGNEQYTFKGENALLNALLYLTADKSRATVYFTQGNGELDFKDSAPSRVDVGMGMLMSELGRVNYQPRELNVAAATDKIPDDADMVVIARPVQPVPDKFLQALRDYLHGTKRDKKGKLIVLFDVVTERGKDTMLRTGLESLVAEYGVRVNDNQLLDLGADRDYFQVKGIVNVRSGNPIAKAFANELQGTLSVFRFYKTRTVEASKANPPGAPPRDTPETLIMTLPRQPILSQTDLRVSASALLEELQRDPQKIMEKLSPSPLPLAVTVSEGKVPAPFPGHEFQAQEGKPRLVVFGDASWISNALLQSSPNNFNLFASSLSWLAERPDLGSRVPPTQHDLYQLKPEPGSALRLLFLPGFLMILGVLALGVGVWVVRRR